MNSLFSMACIFTPPCRLRLILRNQTSMASSKIPTTKLSLLIRVKDRNDEAAWAEFVKVYTPLIYGFSRSRGLSESDARDVTQAVFVRVLKSIGAFEYDPARGRFRAWLGTLTWREIAGQHQKTAADPVFDMSVHDRLEGVVEAE